MAPVTAPAAAASSAADPVAGLRTQADALVKQKTAEDFDKFLLLMTQQLRQQDPLNPANATEFVAQLATFSSVEQSIKANEKLDRLIAAATGLADHSATVLIGRTVETATGRLSAAGQPVGFAYEPVADATRIVAAVRDQGGRLLREIPLPSGAGRLHAVWDGRDAEGDPVTSGRQSIEVLQYREDELLAQAPAILASRVQEIRMEPDGAALVLANGDRLRPADIRAIRDAQDAVTPGVS